jgi:protein JBTS26
LPEYSNDPRVVTNLIDGVNKTRDDIHMWLAPFTTGRNHFIYITFEHPIKIAMIRIWVRVNQTSKGFRVNMEM